MATTYRIKLTPSAPTPIKFEGRNVFRIQIVASDAENMPNEIFGHQQTLVDPDTLEKQDEFCFICSPFDLSTYPANEPAPTQTPAFFRKDTIDILLPGVEIADEVIAEVNDQVAHLLVTLEKLDVLNEGAATWHPSAPVESSESSL